MALTDEAGRCNEDRDAEAKSQLRGEHMKTMKLMLAAMLTTGLIACGDKKAPEKAATPATATAIATKPSATSSSATCESAVKNLLAQYPELGPLNAAPPAGFVEKAEPGMVAACKQRQWKPADLTCLASAKDKAGAAACYNKIDALDRAHASEAAEAALKQLAGK
jgi:hypothetical protein